MDSDPAEHLIAISAKMGAIAIWNQVRQVQQVELLQQKTILLSSCPLSLNLLYIDRLESDCKSNINNHDRKHECPPKAPRTPQHNPQY